MFLMRFSLMKSLRSKHNSIPALPEADEHQLLSPSNAGGRCF